MDFSQTPIINSIQFEERYLIEEQSQISSHKDCTIFKAFDIVNEHNVFIKIPNPNGIEITIQDYDGDFEQLLNLDHNNIIKIHDFFRVEQQLNSDICATLPFIIYEYFEGVTLKSISINQLNESDLVNIFDQVKEGISYLHTKGWVHRDIKSENILVSKIQDKFRVKIIDIENIGHIGFSPKQLVGTPEFLAPEITLNSQLSPSQDYWAYGCLIYEVLLGEPPFGVRNFQLDGINLIQEYQHRINISRLNDRMSFIENRYFKNKIIDSLQLNPQNRKI
jgi:serine/threonine protein kinase